jgi:peptidyl-prolyl cis-trans isomerase C
VMNGDHGWIHRGTVDPELESAFGMKAGQVNGVIRSRVGYHILRLNGYQATQQRSYAQAKKDLITTLEKQREQELRTALETSLRSKARVESQ